MLENKKLKNPWHGVWIAMGLSALFACGVVVGMFCNAGIANLKIARIAAASGAERTCEVVENLLLKQLKYYSAANSPDPEEHMGRANIYAKLGNLGCAENRAAHRDLAFREIAIAHALNNGRFQGKKEVIDRISGYKKMRMDKEACEVFEKVKELTDPAIDFILKIEKIVSE